MNGFAREDEREKERMLEIEEEREEMLEIGNEWVPANGSAIV